MSAGDALRGVGEYAWPAWNAHAALCKRCKTVDLARPASIAAACLEGACLLKAAFAHDARTRKGRAS